MIQDVGRKSSIWSAEWKDASDEVVLSESRNRPELFALLVERYEDAFLRKANSILYRTEDAEEMVQDTFTRIYLYADRFVPQEGAQFSSWAYAILIRLCFTRYQKMKKERGRTMELEPETYERIADADIFLEDLTIRDEVLMAMARMPETASRILRLQFLEGKTQEEIATIEGASVAAVKTRVHRAKKSFKEAFIYGKKQ
ncbi:MAG: RNA polymerase sigma-70 factor, ECF subfamily [Parcubacteria bacterium C7867-008]|nr:MAG: RNA polymerase sigma-70 factor, ECF subfamily [Parcubacteria bacterium C7867-008]